MKILTVIGTRSQFIKAAMVSRAIAKYNDLHKEIPVIREVSLHTGQHYDKNMNAVFFKPLKLKRPHWQMSCSTMSGGHLLAKMITGVDRAILKSDPDYLLVYGNANTALAGALAAYQRGIPLVHIEAGMRSFNRQMLEEKNSVLTDYLSSLLFCSTTTSVENLAKENITEGVFCSGDVMYDAALFYEKKAEEKSTIMKKLGLQSGQFRLCTIHRMENIDKETRLKQIIEAIVQISKPSCPVVLPLHPHTKDRFNRFNLNELIVSNTSIIVTEPLDYLDMIILEKNAETIITDSNGVQKEAYFHQIPCITLREDTEWPETIKAGWNQLVGFETENIVKAFEKKPERTEINEYGDGHACDKIIQTIVNHSIANLK